MDVTGGQAQSKGKTQTLRPSFDATVAVKPASSHTPNKKSLDFVLRTGLAGGLAGCAVSSTPSHPSVSLCILTRYIPQAKTIVGPLDRVKILFQASNPQFAKYTGSWFGVVTAMRDINRQSGIRGLFRGHSATLLRIFPYAAIKFLAYEQIRAILIPTKQHETPLRRLFSGAFAGVTSVFFTYPLEVIRVRLAFETKSEGRVSLRSICEQIYHEQPPRISSSSASSAIATATTIPTPRSGLVNFYRGFSSTLAGMLPYAGMSFLTHDTAGDWLRLPALAPYTTAPNPKNPSAPPILTYWAELLAGGFAGLVSQTASYPLEVIRRRMQVGGAVGDGHRLGMAETAGRVWRERGWRGFFIGLGIGYFKVVPMAAVSFYVYERGKVLLGV
ncbi:MAG: hypothetical protein Q9225_007512 [Loekoesia sp. 1 TL-2023]